MIEAMYGIEFLSDSNSFGYGIAVLDRERIFGGDSSFVFSGHYKIDNNLLYADFECTNDRQFLQSIFGEKNKFNLHLEGTPAPYEFSLKGFMVEDPAHKVTVILTRRAELP